MQVFIIGSPLETAMILDKKRLNKQIVECGQILSALNGESKSWLNHPCTLQYKNHKQWLHNYKLCLYYYKCGDYEFAKKLSNICDINRPQFHTNEYFNQMKRRLYTKDNKHYYQFNSFGESNVNWYYVNNSWKYYENGKQIKKD